MNFLSDSLIDVLAQIVAVAIFFVSWWGSGKVVSSTRKGHVVASHTEFIERRDVKAQKEKCEKKCAVKKGCDGNVFHEVLARLPDGKNCRVDDGVYGQHLMVMAIGPIVALPFVCPNCFDRDHRTSGLALVSAGLVIVVLWMGSVAKMLTFPQGNEPLKTLNYLGFFSYLASMVVYLSIKWSVQ